MPTIDFLWNEWDDNLFQETDEYGVVTSYVTMPGKHGEVLYDQQGNRFTYYHYDGNGSTHKLTGANQAVTKTYIFTGFGELIASPGLGSTPFAYKGAAGYYTNPVTNDIYVRARSYEPTTGRWLSKDPLGFVDGPNLYGAYFVPSGVDPTGLILRFGQEKDDVCVALLDDHEDSSTPNRPAKRWIEQARRLTNNCWERVTVITEIADLVRKCQCCTLYIIGHRGGKNNPGGATTFPPGSGDEGVNILPGKPPHGGVLAREFLFLGCKRCRINIVTCGDTDTGHTDGRRKISEDTGCEVCGSKSTIVCGGDKPVPDDPKAPCVFLPDRTGSGPELPGQVPWEPDCVYSPKALPDVTPKTAIF